MQCAVYVPNFGTFGDVQTTIELAKLAEASGWNGFFIWDHLLPGEDSSNGPVADPWIVLAAIAVATQRIRLGALITPLPRRRPWQVARATVTLDHLAQGRLVVGAGIGGDWWHEYSAFGQDIDERTHGAMLDEALEVLTQLWTGTPVSYTGTYYTLDNARFLPTPYQSPRIPIWLAGTWPRKRPFRRAAQWDGIVPAGLHGNLTPQDIGEMLAYIQSHRPESRHTATPFDVVMGGRMFEKPVEESSALLSEFAAAGVTWWLEIFWPDASLAQVQSVIQNGPPRQAA
jgi:alkanesulfonate monooxygenase SsuD/methylene tetrahydromethanopterin reductase-like flavin-dependent oxidoreductase (luciferase family)